ncbi:hypothetical protein L9G15_04955 [Shewanella sp. A3A]|nr:hypothetical protein [Shewanella ferrihydritica]
MKLTAEISMYPLTESDYKEPIRWLIKRLGSYPNIQRVTHSLGTQISGDCDEIMHILATEMKATDEKWGKAMFVCKFVEGELDLNRRT